MGKRKAEGSNWEFRGTEQVIYTWLEVSTKDIISEEAKSIEATNPQPEATSLSAGIGSLSGEPRVVTAPEGPTVKAAGGGVTTSGEATVGMSRQPEDELELHPFWQLLELAGYERL